MKLRTCRLLFALLIVPVVTSAGAACAAPAKGPLRVCPENPRYFTDSSGKAILLTGAHTWNEFVDMGPTDPPPAFDFDAFLDWVVAFDHNFVRGWTWELVSWDTRGNGSNLKKEAPHNAAPLPYARTGPGLALDGKPKFDLTMYNDEYFKRLHSRIAKAGDKGVYVSVMLFEGWGLQFSPGAWAGHPCNPANNINGIDGDANGDGMGLEVHELVNPKLTAIQEAYVRHVIDTVNDLDNVLYEISNENHPASTGWQYHMVDFIHAYEKTKPKQHPVGMTFQFKGGSNQTLFDSPAEWISPNKDDGYRDNPPAATGAKVILSDTDHLWGIGGNVPWVWMSVTRGLNPQFMDPYDGGVLGNDPQTKYDPIRENLGYARKYADQMNLAAMTPRNGLASSKFCLANPGVEYLVFVPKGGEVRVDLSKLEGKARVEWLNPEDGKTQRAGNVDGGDWRTLTAPFEGGAVLFLKKVK